MCGVNRMAEVGGSAPLALKQSSFKEGESKLECIVSLNNAGAFKGTNTSFESIVRLCGDGSYV